MYKVDSNAGKANYGRGHLGTRYERKYNRNVTFSVGWGLKNIYIFRGTKRSRESYLRFDLQYEEPQSQLVSAREDFRR
jgi:hypothetical protein